MLGKQAGVVIPRIAETFGRPLGEFRHFGARVAHAILPQLSHGRKGRSLYGRPFTGEMVSVLEIAAHSTWQVDYEWALESNEP